METPMQTPAVKGKNRSLKLIIMIVATVLVLGAAGGVYYYMTQQPAQISTENDTPPALKLNTLQGKSIETGFYIFDATDVLTAPTNAVLGSTTRGVNYFYSEKEMTVQQIIAHIKPIVGMRYLFAIFIPENAENEPACCFYVYPHGPYSGTKTITDITTFKIPAYAAFSIMTDQLPKPQDLKADATEEERQKYQSAMKEWNEKNVFNYVKSVPGDSNWGIKTATEPASNFTLPINENKTGWVLVPLPNISDAEGFKKAISPYSGKLAKLFPQNGMNSFTELTNADNFIKTNFNMVWIKVKSTPVTQAQS